MNLIYEGSPRPDLHIDGVYCLKKVGMIGSINLIKMKFEDATLFSMSLISINSEYSQWICVKWKNVVIIM